MKIWKRNAVVAVVLLFICTGIYLNWSFNQAEEVVDLTETLDQGAVLSDATLVINDEIPDQYLYDIAVDAVNGEALEPVSSVNTEYFSTIRLARQEARDSALELLQEAAAYSEAATGDTMSSAAADLEEMVRTALNEAQIESLVIAKGYADCVAFMSDDGISLAVAAPVDGFQVEDVAVISDIVIGESAYTMSDLKIIEVR